MELYDIFGSVAGYYRYRDGEYDITPDLQARVEAAFRKHGVEEPPIFDHTTLAYYFPNE